MTETCSAATKLWVSALLIVIIIGSLTAFAYTSSNDALKDSVRQGMKSTAAVMATQINASDLAGIKPGDEILSPVPRRGQATAHDAQSR